MLTIKLAKVGKKNKKMFRIIISEKSKDPYGRALEILGSYNPYSKELKIKGDRVKYWISKGSGMTPSINNLLVEHKIVEGKKEVNSKVGSPNKRKVDKVEKEKKKVETDKATEEAKKQAEIEAKASAKAAAEAPVEAPIETPETAAAETPTPEDVPAEADLK